jgi:hypothetical protein
MALLLEKTVVPIDATGAQARTKTAGTKLTTAEFSALEVHCRRFNITHGELIRRLIFAEIQRGKEPQKADLVLTEIVGIRLLLVNLLGPLTSGQEPITKERLDQILNEVKRVKQQVALDLQNRKQGGENK